MLSQTNPNQTNPFRVILSNAPADITSYEISGTYATSSYTGYFHANILSQGVRDNYGVEVFGEVQNPHSRELRFTKVVATFYNSDGTVINADYSYAANNYLPPNGVTTYKISTFDDFTYARYSLFAEGYFGSSLASEQVDPDGTIAPKQFVLER